MWRNYLTVAFRALTKNWTYAFITIFGLALGLAGCLTILLYVRYELSYDRWVPGADRVFQFQTVFDHPETGLTAGQQSSYAARTAFVKDFPQIERSVLLQKMSVSVIQGGQPTPEDDLIMADANLFDVIDLPFVKGDPRHALDRPGDIVLTQSEASTRFPGQDPIGKTVTIALGGMRRVDHKVTGIIRDLPKNSHMRFDMVARYDPPSFYSMVPNLLTNWGNQSFVVYVKLRRGVGADAIHAQMPAWEERNVPDEVVVGETFRRRDTHDWRLTNIRDIHLGDAQGGNDRGTVIAFALVALLILGMAVVNFVNLATARASQRAREVALRKVVGASRRQLIVQFIGESILVTALAMLLGLAGTELLLPYVNTFLEADMTIHYLGSDGLLLPIILLVIVVGAVGGLYPAFYLSRFQPAAVLKANRSSTDAQGSGGLRNLLVIGQFAVSIGLIICTAVIYAQIIHARTMDAGYRRDGLIHIENIPGFMPRPQLETLVRALESTKGVQRAGFGQIGVNPGMMSNTFMARPGHRSVVIGAYSIDPGFFDAMGMRLLAGRFFDHRIALDETTQPFPQNPAVLAKLRARGGNAILSEVAARNLGFASPQAAIGKLVAVPIGPEGDTMRFTIVGVVKDARLRSIRVPVEPILYRYQNIGFTTMVVRYESDQPHQVMADLDKTWRRLMPNVAFKGSFVDDRLRDMYKGDEARSQIFGIFALLAVVIGCLGLFGLAAFTAERRTKEIGIRKVLGARTRDIVRLLAWQFSKPVVIANLIAWPVAWWLMRDWLNEFDSRIALSPTYFLLAGALALIIAISTIAVHAMKVARANPIHALRYE